MPTILIVDDDAFTRSGLSVYLGSLGHQLCEAGDVQTAWEFMNKVTPALVILDIMLPLRTNGRFINPPSEPHGISLGLRIKETFPLTGIVFLSAHQEYEAQVQHLMKQFLRSIAFLHKGGDMSRLNVAIQEVLAGRTHFQADTFNRQALATAVAAHFTSLEAPWIEQATAEFTRLSPREKEVAHLLSASYTPEYIAERLKLSKGSVDNLVSRIYNRLGLTDMKTDCPGLRPLAILIKVCLLYDIQHSP